MLQIKTENERLAFELRDTKPEGVSVTVQYPRMNRSHDVLVPLAWYVTVTFTATVDVGAVASWLFNKLKGDKGAKTTYNRIDVKLTAKEIRLIIERETNSDVRASKRRRK